jgi:3-hydroxyisobutyrate dehydrogenase-like beta-hydroxyacid dehydrogenase
MGSAVGAALSRGGAHDEVALVGRSDRTRRLAEAAGLTVMGSLDEVVGAADVLLSIAPPEAADAIADDLARAAAVAGSQPLVADLNAISPMKARALRDALRAASLDLVDGSISGPPPRRAGTTRIYLSGERAAEIAALPFEGVELTVVGDEIGAASAVKMSTASVYKGSTALLVQALQSAHANGVLGHVLSDLGIGAPDLVANVVRRLASAAAKSERYVGEMREISTTQAAAGLTPALFEAMAEIYAAIATTPLSATSPENLPIDTPLEDLLGELR